MTGRRSNTAANAVAGKQKVAEAEASGQDGTRQERRAFLFRFVQRVFKLGVTKKIIDDIKITPVEHADEVLKIALTKELKRVEWVEVEQISKTDDKSQASIQ